MRTVQIIFGILLIYFPLSRLLPFLQILPAPQSNEAAMAFFVALMATGYIFPILTGVFFIAGLMFIFNKWSAFGAVLLVPMTVNIMLFHIFLDFTGFWIALVFAVLNVYLLAIHWPRYKTMFAK